MASDRGKSFDPGETFGDTIGPTRGVGLGGELATPEFPTLTLLHHPDLERVGERCVLAPLRGASRATVVSRTEPEFVCPRGGPRRALNDGRISRRRPLRIDWRADGGVDLYAEADGPAVEVDGVPLRGLESYSAQRVTQGLVVMMAERVVLLVHATDGLAAESLGHGMVGESDAVQQVRRHVSRYAGETQIGILVRGESGTGKELVARALHEAGPRAGRPFVAVNMGAVTRSLASAELFGSVRGAFNDARDHGGYVGAAERGTLFLDEIGETPSEVQPLLLRFLQDGTYERVGSSATRQADVRIVTATDAPLEDAVASGQFRRALYGRVAQHQITLAPLRERREDVGRLMAHFITEEMRARDQAHRLDYVDGHTRPWLPAPVMAALARYDWPTNIRELRGVAQQLVIMNHDEAVARPQGQLLDLIRQVAPQPAHAPKRPEQQFRRTEKHVLVDVVDVLAPPPDPKTRRPDSFTEAEVRRALAKHKREPTPTAKALGISKTTLYELMDKHGIKLAKHYSLAELEAAIDDRGGDDDLAAQDLFVSRRGLRARLKELKGP